MFIYMTFSILFYTFVCLFIVFLMMYYLLSTFINSRVIGINVMVGMWIRSKFSDQDLQYNLTYISYFVLLWYSGVSQQLCWISSKLESGNVLSEWYDMEWPSGKKQTLYHYLKRFDKQVRQLQTSEFNIGDLQSIRKTN